MTRASARKGFTLLEVMLATGLLLGSVIVLAELASIGREHANAVEDLATAELLCQNRVNEIVVGALPLEPMENEYLGEDDWMCSVALEPLAQPGLVALRVTVSREASPTRRARKFSLVRWIPDPGISSGDVESSSTYSPDGKSGSSARNPATRAGELPVATGRTRL